MPMDYGLCCMGEDCIMPCKTVTFYHQCITCGRLLHVPCGETDIDDQTTCKRCFHAQHPNIVDKSPKKAILDYLSMQSTPVVVEAAVQEPPSSDKAQAASMATTSIVNDIATNAKATSSPPPKTTCWEKQKRDGAGVRIRIREAGESYPW
jgi:hypothetical protein